jgi:hypothetical protein
MPVKWAPIIKESKAKLKGPQCHRNKKNKTTVISELYGTDREARANFANCYLRAAHEEKAGHTLVLFNPLKTKRICFI